MVSVADTAPISIASCRSATTVPRTNTPWPMKTATNRQAGR
jgi:hypothetical protein